MGTTPSYGFPYPELADSPNVPADMQALATDLDTTVGGIDSRLTTTESDVSALQARHPSPVLGVWQGATDTISVPGDLSSNTLIWTLSITDPGFAYRVRVYSAISVDFSPGGSGGYGRVNVRIGSVDGGTQVYDGDVGRLSAGWSTAIVPGILTGSLTGDQVITVSVRTSQSANATRSDARGLCSADILST